MEEPRHYSVIDKFERKVSLKYKGEIIVESTEAMILKEVGKSVYNPVFYFPKEDIKVKLELESERHSTCPIKGEATYWNIEGDYTDNYFAWSYEDVNPRARKIKGYIAFNMEYLTLISEPLSE